MYERMGKFISRLKKSSYSSNAAKYRENTQNNDESFKYEDDNSSPGTMKLRQVENFQSYEDVLNISCVSNTTCLFGTNDYSLQLFDFIKNKKIKTWKGHEKDITKVIYCPRIDRYLSASRDKTIKYWSLNSDIPEFNLLSHDLVVTALSSNKENDMLMSGSRDNKLVLWDLKTGRIISNAQISRNLITDVFWSVNQNLLIQTSEDKEVRLWDPSNLKVIHSFPKKQYIQSSCHISSDSNYAISSSNGFQGNGCEITVWDLRKRELLSELIGHEQSVNSAKLVQSDKIIASCSNDSTVRLWDFETKKLIDTLYTGASLTSLSESPSNKNLLVTSLSNGIFNLSMK